MRFLFYLCVLFDMNPPVSIDVFVGRAKQAPVIDVRSPAEYVQGHIPGARNLPLFDNEERAEVGTVYKQKGRIPAVQRGLEIVGPKMRRLTDFVLQLNSPELLLYCWRGGMRSTSMAWLFEAVDIRCFTLEHGYKAYRHHVLDSFSKPLKMALLGGFTGGGKTEILRALRANGEQVLDLEHLAHHKGSAFGGMGQAPQPATEHFENLIAAHCAQIDSEKTLWIEDESRNVGRCSIPIAFWEQMRRAPLVCVQTPRAIRVEHLMQEYAHFDTEFLCEAIKKIEKRLGFDHCKAAYESCLIGKRQAALEICLDYYDKAYANQLFERFGAEWERRLPRFAPHFPLDSEQIEALVSLLRQ